MKRVKTLLSIFLCIMACALFGACSCSGTDISVVAIAIAEVSDNLVKDEGSSKYLVRKGETFTVTYEIKPDNASDLTTYVEVNPANKITSNKSIFRTNKAKNTVEFKASSVNTGESLITFTTRDGSANISIRVEIIDDNMVFSAPQNLKYGRNETSGLYEFTWDHATVETDNHGLLEASKYAIIINGERIETDTNSYAIDLQSATDYFVRLQALGDLQTRTSDGPITSEERFYVASTPKNLKANKGVLTWDYDDESNIDQFVLDFDKYSVPLEDTSVRKFDLASYIRQKNITGLGNFNLKLTAVNTEFANGATNDGNIMTYILNSRNNPSLSLTQLYAPTNLKIQAQKQPGDIYASSMLSWDKVTNASSYLLSVFKNGQQLGQLSTGQNVINLSKAEFVQDAILSKTSGNYTIRITPQGDDGRTFIQNTDYASFDFVITPFLYGNVNYTNDKLNLLTEDLLTMLDLTTDDLSSKIKYEVYYTEEITGHYDHTTTIDSPTTEIALSEVIDLSGAYNILVRPVPSESYTTKNVVLPMLDQIQFNKSTTSMITQLKGVSITNISTDGVLTGVDENQSENVDKYRFELTTPSGPIKQYIYRNNINLVFDNNTFSISLVNLFNIQVAGDYSIKIVPMSDSKIDANPAYCNNYAFKQLAEVDPSTIEINNNVITWGNVANYSSYTIKINDEEEVVVNTNSYTVEDNSILLNNNTITIQVNGNGTNTISSKTVSVNKLRAEVVSGFKVEDGVLTWDGSVANSTYYITITYPEENVESIVVNTNSYSGLDKISTSANITISRGMPTRFNSEESDVISIDRLSAPTNDMEIVNHSSTAKFTVVENANKYKITIKNGTTVIKEYLISTEDSTATIVDTKVNFTIDSLEAGNYSIYIQAIPSDQNSTDYETNETFYLISNTSQNNDFVVYPKVVVSNKTHVLNWTFASSYEVKEYTIHFENDEYGDIVTANNTYTFEEIDAGEYTIVLSATSNVDNVIYSESTTTTIVKTQTPNISYNDGKVKFDLVSTASGYNVYSSDDTLLVADEDYEITIVENTAYITPLDLQEGVNYSIYIVAIGDTDVLDGDKSNSVEFSIIDSVSEISMTTVDGKKVFTWNNVDGNDGYFITLKSGETTLETYTADTNSYSIDKYLSGENKFTKGNYTISVVVLSDTLVNSNPVSATFTKLGVISNTDLNNNVISWQYTDAGTPTAYKLSVFVDNEGTWTSVKSVNITHLNGVNPTYDLNELSEYNNYQIAITVVGDDSKFTLDGDMSTFTFTYGEQDENTRDTFSKIEAPSFSFSNGKLQLLESDNAESYELYSFDGEDATLLTYEYTMDSDLYINLIEADVTYTIAAKAVALSTSGKLNSDYSAKVVVNKLSAITDLSVNSSGLITWDVNNTNAAGYLVYNLTTDQTVLIEGGATESITYSELYTKFGLELASTNEFAIQVIGGIKSGVNYLNSEISNSITIHSVDNVSTITLDNGQLSWDDVAGVSSYNLIIDNDTKNKVTNVVVNTNSYNINSYTDIANGDKVDVKVVPFSTRDNSYIINAVTPTEISLQRYNVIQSVSVEDGLIKLELNISDITGDDLLAILGADDYSTLSSEIQQKYYGYYNFRINVDGTNIDITLNDMSYEINATDIANGVFYATYQLNYDVDVTKLLNIQISSIGNKVSNAMTYGAIASIPNEENHTILKAYKHSAPVVTVNNNMISEKGIIEFQKIEGVTGYVLTAKSNDETLTLTFNTDGSSGNHRLGSASIIEFFNSASGKQTQVKGNTEYRYTLTTLGTDSWTGEATIPHLRSNAYNTVTLTFLKKPDVQYVYSDEDTHGGHISWPQNNDAQSYKLYALNINDVKKYYGEVGSATYTDAMEDYDWLGKKEVYTCEVSRDKSAYKFEEGGFSRVIESGVQEGLDSGTYWIAVQPIGDDVTYITPVGCSNTIAVYKVNEVKNVYLENGAFYWSVDDKDASDYVFGFKISISVFGEEDKVIELPQLIPNSGVYSYTLDESVTDVNNVTHSLYGYTGEGEDKVKESYGISIIAIGKNTLDASCVNSYPVSIDNNGRGYQRLDIPKKLGVSDNRLTWELSTTLNEEVLSDDVMGYTLFINGVEIEWQGAAVGIGAVPTTTFDKGTSSLLFSGSELFKNSGDYHLQIKAMAADDRYLSSIKSAVLTAVKFTDPVITAEKGIFNWESEIDGKTHQPQNSNLTILLSDGTQKFAGNIDTFEYALDNNSDYPGGDYYTAKVVYNGYYDQDKDTYYIASNEATLTAYKLDRPVVQDVENFKLNESDKECSDFKSCLKWKIIKDENENNIVKYQILVSVFNGEVYVRNNDYSRIVEDVTNSNYSSFAIYKADTGYVYYNITDITDNENIKGSIKIAVVALGSNRLNSSPMTKEIDYSRQAPVATADDYGVIRWEGENEVYITLEYNLQGNTTIEYTYLNDEYINKYGKVYYLPYMARYTSVQLQYVIAGCFTSNTTTVAEGLDIQALFFDGDGSEDDPYIIKSFTIAGDDETKTITEEMQIKNMQYRPLSYIEIDDNINSIVLSNNWTTLERFGGVFDGNGCVISNIKLPKPSGGGVAYLSMFKNVLQGAIIKNFTLSFATVMGTADSTISNTVYLAGIAYKNEGTIDNVRIMDTITTYNNQSIYFGSISIYNYGTISNVNNSITLAIDGDNGSDYSGSTFQAGGITCYNYGLIDYCVNSGSISMVNGSMTTKDAAGIAVYNRGAILNSQFTGSLKAFSMAGIALENYFIPDATLTLKVTNGELETTYEYNTGHILGCYSTGKFELSNGSTTNTIYIAGIVGYNDAGVIGRCYANISSDSSINFNQINASHVYVGGLVAFNTYKEVESVYYWPTIENSYVLMYATFTKTSNISKGAVVATYASDLNLGEGIEYDYGYGLYGVKCYSSTLNTFASSNLNNSIKTPYLYKLDSSSALTTGESINQLNNVRNTEKYVHIRTFNDSALLV